MRDKEKREVDFLTVRDGRTEWLVETKLADTEIAFLKHFSGFFVNPVRKSGTLPPAFSRRKKISVDSTPPHGAGLSNGVKETKPILLVKNLKRELFLDGIHVKKAGIWLQSLEA